ncbi:hypothetical protein PVAR5_1246 [Paecilomyces variotii No. 5]|uniref:Uncharacterized protein n=1 Tax=Byssochlamys spectabilis (strain No. 5 / NBRC 109023) TaxID=1356009 RepID=V5FLE2_BYSSN|nr:hypothetical protein PVAR5_1246 [Paecilomyces variotii No. 5]
MFLTSNILAVTYEKMLEDDTGKTGKTAEIETPLLCQRGVKSIDIAGKKDAQKTEAVEHDRRILNEFSGCCGAHRGCSSGEGVAGAAAAAEPQKQSHSARDALPFDNTRFPARRRPSRDPLPPGCLGASVWRQSCAVFVADPLQTLWSLSPLA